MNSGSPPTGQTAAPRKRMTPPSDTLTSPPRVIVPGDTFTNWPVDPIVSGPHVRLLVFAIASVPELILRGCPIPRMRSVTAVTVPEGLFIVERPVGFVPPALLYV